MNKMRLKAEIRITKLIHPFFLRLLPLARNFPLTPFKVQEIPNTCPIIFISNHSNMHDFPVAAEIIKRHVFVLADDEPRKKITGIAFNANGVIWVNRLDKASRQEAFEKMRLLLARGENILMYPEGTWNLSDNLPMLPFPWGVIQLAQETGCPVVPVTLEFPDMKSCFYSIGRSIYFGSTESKLDAVNRLRDELASMRWEYWASRGLHDRKQISERDRDVYVEARIKEYPVFNYEFEQGMVFQTGKSTPAEAFAHLNKLIPCRENAFLFRKD